MNNMPTTKQAKPTHTVLLPGTKPNRFSSGFDHEINNTYATDLGVAGYEVTVWFDEGDRGDIYRLNRVWVNDDGPDMTATEIAAWVEAHPNLGDDLAEAVADKISDIGDP